MARVQQQPGKPEITLPAATPMPVQKPAEIVKSAERVRRVIGIEVAAIEDKGQRSIDHCIRVDMELQRGEVEALRQVRNALIDAGVLGNGYRRDSYPETVRWLINQVRTQLAK